MQRPNYWMLFSIWEHFISYYTIWYIMICAFPSCSQHKMEWNRTLWCGVVHFILPGDIPAMCPGSMPLYGVSTSSVHGSPTVHVDALEIWLTLLVGELFRLFFEVINTFTFFKPDKNYHQHTKTSTTWTSLPLFPSKVLLWSMSPVHQAWVPYPTSVGHGHVNVHHPPRLSLWWWESWPHVLQKPPGHATKKVLCTIWRDKHDWDW